MRMRKSFIVVLLLVLAASSVANIAFTDARMQAPGTPGTTGTPGSPVAQPELTAEVLLAECPCEPADYERFHELVYPSGLPMTPAPDPDWTDEQREVEVAALLEARLSRRSPEVQERARDVFAEARELMDVRLAAALAMLVGTSGEPAIDVMLDAQWDSLGFGAKTRPGWTAGIDDSDQWNIVIDQSVQHEDFLWIAPIMVREALHAHRGDGAGREEAAVAVLMQRIVLVELLDTYPEIATQKTSFSRGQLTYTLALLYNSKSVMEGRGETLFPGGEIQVASVWNDALVGQHRESPTLAPPVLGGILDKLGIDASDAPDSNDDGVPDFTVDLLERLKIEQIIGSPGSPLSAEDVGMIGETALTIDFPQIAGAEPTATPSPTATVTISAGTTDLTDVLNGLIQVSPTPALPSQVPPTFSPPTATSVPPPPPGNNNPPPPPPGNNNPPPP